VFSNEFSIYMGVYTIGKQCFNSLLDYVLFNNGESIKNQFISQQRKVFMNKLVLSTFLVLILTTACGELSTPNTIAEPTSVSSAFTTSEEYFNRPFITIDETLGLFAGMPTASVLSLCGKPLYVATGDSEKVIWVYQVRELLVGNEQGQKELVKTSNTTVFSNNLHFIALTFEYDQLSLWTRMDIMNGSMEVTRDSDAEH